VGDARDGATERALELVLRERDRQRAEWGEDEHPDVGQPWWLNRACRDGALARTEDLRAYVEAGKYSDFGAGWLEILCEEVGGARDAAEVVASVSCADRPAWRAELRRELAQVAAVAVAWLEDLERRDAAEVGDGGQG